MPLDGDVFYRGPFKSPGGFGRADTVSFDCEKNRFSEQTAVLLIAHGSRRPEANQDLVQLAKMIGSQGRYDLIEVSYLELASPTILEGGRRCVEQGAKRVLMFPYFLSAGVHVVTDLNEIRDQLAAEFPDVKFILCHHLGLHPLMTELVMLRLSEADR